MNEQRFEYGETDLFEWVEFDGEMISTKECVNKLNEQQAIISQLQDLCGESDSENAKLRIENKKLKEKNEQLKEQLQMIKRIIQTQITEKEEDLRTSVKGGMPTGGLYSEIELLEKLKKEL